LANICAFPVQDFVQNRICANWVADLDLKGVHLV